jgi:hypothetical protein
MQNETIQVIAQLIGVILKEAELKGKPLSVRDATAAALRRCEGGNDSLSHEIHTYIKHILLCVKNIIIIIV